LKCAYWAEVGVFAVRKTHVGPYSGLIFLRTSNVNDCPTRFIVEVFVSQMYDL
jgi:hypothetical protein